MPIVAEVPKNPAISVNTTPIAAVLSPALFRAAYQAVLDAIEDKVQLAVAYSEELTEAIGNGAISGGIISIGAGLAVNVSALKALVGTVTENDATQTVGSLTASALNFLFLRQNGTWTINTTGAVPVNITTHGAFLFWGTATTNVSTVTAVSNARQGFAPRAEYDELNAYQTETIPHGTQKIIMDSLTCYGTLTVHGKMRII